MSQRQPFRSTDQDDIQAMVRRDLVPPRPARRSLSQSLHEVQAKVLSVLSHGCFGGTGLLFNGTSPGPTPGFTNPLGCGL